MEDLEDWTNSDLECPTCSALIEKKTRMIEALSPESQRTFQAIVAIAISFQDNPRPIERAIGFLQEEQLLFPDHHAQRNINLELLEDELEHLEQEPK